MVTLGYDKLHTVPISSARASVGHLPRCCIGPKMCRFWGGIVWGAAWGRGYFRVAKIHIVWRQDGTMYRTSDPGRVGGWGRVRLKRVTGYEKDTIGVLLFEKKFVYLREHIEVLLSVSVFVTK